MKKPILTRRAFLAAAASLAAAAGLSACDSRFLRQLLLVRAEQTTTQTVTPASDGAPAPTQRRLAPARWWPILPGQATPPGWPSKFAA